MTLEIAIEIVTILEGRSINNSRMFKKDALKLLIEAGKREKANRDNPDYVIVGKLPGETEE